MSYDEGLAERIRALVGERPGVTEKEMFGGVAFMLNGNMFVGIVKDDLMVRVGPVRHAEALGQPHARPMDFAGRPMQGYVYVAPPGFETDAGLDAWVERAAAFVATLPAKLPGMKKTMSKEGSAKALAKAAVAKKAVAKKPVAKKAIAKKAIAKKAIAKKAIAKKPVAKKPVAKKKA